MQFPRSFHKKKILGELGSPNLLCIVTLKKLFVIAKLFFVTFFVCVIAKLFSSVRSTRFPFKLNKLFGKIICTGPSAKGPEKSHSNIDPKKSNSFFMILVHFCRFLSVQTV